VSEISSAASVFEVAPALLFSELNAVFLCGVSVNSADRNFRTIPCWSARWPGFDVSRSFYFDPHFVASGAAVFTPLNRGTRLTEEIRVG